MNKKRLFAIVLFIVLGLFMFTFANPRNNKDDKKLNGDIITPEQQEEVKEPVITTPDEETTEIIITQPVVNNNQTRVNKETTEQQVVPTIDLTKDKQQAIDELNNYRKDYEFTNDEEYNKIIDEYTDKINNSDSKEEISKNLEDGKDAIDKVIEEDLEAYKEKAKEEVQKYADDLDFITDITPVITKIDATIDSETTKDAIDQDVKDAKDLLDKLKEEEINAAKDAAIEELENYRKDYNYSEENQDNYKNAVEDGINAIEKAQSIEEILKELKEAEENIDTLINNDLDAYKEKAKEEIENYNKDMYSEENEKIVQDIKDNAKDDITNTNIDNEDQNIATVKEEIDKIVEEAKKKIEGIQKLKDTKFKVTFIGLNGVEITSADVLYDNAATAPEMDEYIIDKRIKYHFDGWDKEFANIKEETVVYAQYSINSIYSKVSRLADGIAIPKNGGNAGIKNYTQIGEVELNISNPQIYAKLLKAINDSARTNRSQVVTLDDATIRSYVNEESEVMGPLPEVNELNYKYQFYVLKFIYDDGFHIDATKIVDEEALARNTVVVTYTINDEKATFSDNTKIKEVKVINGHNIVELPKVYENEKELNVTWTDENNELLDEYTSNMTVTATVDRTAPVLTIKGDKTVNIFEGHTYNDLGATATDNYDGDLTDKITVDGTVNTSKVGTYTLTYTVADGNGNEVSDTRTVIVNEVKLESVTLSKDSGTYVKGQEFDKSITLTATYNDSTYKEYTYGEYTVTGFDKDNTGSRTATITANDNEALSATYSYTVSYSQTQLADLFKNTTAQLYSNWYWMPFVGGTPYMIINNLPEGAEVANIRREDSKNLGLIKSSNDKYYFSDVDEYKLIRHNDNKTIYITYSINSQTYTKAYDEEFGYVE